MKLLRRRDPEPRPELSIVLLDWNCRESFHSLDYLANQNVERSRYEVIWVEFYDHIPPALKEKLDRDEPESPLIDTWALLQAEPDVPYHKHWLFNAGLALARGRYVAFCDSDAMYRPTFVRALLDAFEQDPSRVVHMDEVRNLDPTFYPFHHPPLEQVEGYGSINWVDARPGGLLDRADPIHSRNYGACMAAARDELIRIGGADLHDEYLGFICGPYEMTWRLVNAGAQEYWIHDEWLYHTWHPGQAGDGNLCGPHDGLQIAARALNLRDTGRSEPFEICPATGKLREEGKLDDEQLCRLLDPGPWQQRWRDVVARAQVQMLRLGRKRIHLRRTEARDQQGRAEQKQPQPLFGRRMPRACRVHCMLWALGRLPARMRTKRLAARASRPGLPASRSGEIARKLRAGRRFVSRILDYDRWRLRQGWLLLAWCAQQGYNRLAIYGEPETIDMLGLLARYLPVKIEQAIELFEDPQPLIDLELPMVIGTFLGAEDWRDRLIQAGAPANRIHVLL